MRAEQEASELLVLRLQEVEGGAGGQRAPAVQALTLNRVPEPVMGQAPAARDYASASCVKSDEKLTKDHVDSDEELTKDHVDSDEKLTKDHEKLTKDRVDSDEESDSDEVPDGDEWGPFDPPEWYYLDHNGDEWGPFDTMTMRGWYTQGIVDADLMMRLKSWTAHRPLRDLLEKLTKEQLAVELEARQL